MAEDEVGSLGRELTDLFRTLATANAQDQRTSQSPHATAEPHEPASCPHGWCPLCQVVEAVRDNPEMLEQVLDAATTFARSVRDMMGTVSQGTDRRKGDEP